MVYAQFADGGLPFGVRVDGLAEGIDLASEVRDHLVRFHQEHDDRHSLEIYSTVTSPDSKSVALGVSSRRQSY